MAGAAWIELLTLLVLLAVSIPLFGNYMARVFDGESAPGDRVFKPVEHVIYRISGIDPDREQRWTVYAMSVLAFSVLSVLFVYLVQRIQGHLPFNPTGMSGVQDPALAFNTAVSFVTNKIGRAHV